MENKTYKPEEYWSEVGSRIQNREDGHNVIAGDDEPYYRYKRERFLALLNQVDFTGKKVLEIGSGPGGNLLEISKKEPLELKGVDISETMVNLANRKLPEGVRVVKIDGQAIPFEDRSFDIVFSATVLQHNTDEAMLLKLMKEMARVSADKVILFERIENEIKGDELCLGRPVSYYARIMEESGFYLSSSSFINIRVSYYISGAARKLLNPRSRKEGEALTAFSLFIQKATLPITRLLDKVFTSKKDVARLTFERMT